MIKRTVVIALSLSSISCSTVFEAVTGLTAYYKVNDEQVTYHYWNPLSGQDKIYPLPQANPKTFEQINPNYGNQSNPLC